MQTSYAYAVRPKNAALEAHAPSAHVGSSFSAIASCGVPHNLISIWLDPGLARSTDLRQSRNQFLGEVWAGESNANSMAQLEQGNIFTPMVPITRTRFVTTRVPIIPAEYRRSHHLEEVRLDLGSILSSLRVPSFVMAGQLGAPHFQVRTASPHRGLNPVNLDRSAEPRLKNSHGVMGYATRIKCGQRRN